MKRLLQFFTLLTLALVGGAETMLAEETTEWLTVKSWNLKTLSWTKETGFGTNTITINKVACTYCTGALEGLALQGGTGTSWTVNSSGLTQGNGGRNIAILDLKAGDVVNISTATTLSSIVNGTGETYTGDCSFTVTLDGAFGFNTTRGAYISKIEVIREKKAGVCEKPGYNLSAAGTSRKFTLSCMTGDAVIYYSETELAVGDDGWKVYTSEVTTEAENIYAYAKTADATSEVISFETGAGIEIQLNAPTVSIDFIKNGNVYTPVYSFASDQNDVTYKPTAILSYTINDGESVIGQSYIANTTGKLVITASAEGYVSASTTIDISNNMFKRTFNYDFSSFTEHSATTVGNQTNVNSKGCQAYELAEDAVEGITINMNLLWALTADEAVGLYARAAKGSITYNGDFPEGSYAVFSNYGTPVVSSSATTSFALYGLALDMAVYVPAETITLPADYTYSTFCSTKALDFTDNADVEAYIAQVENDGVTVTLTKVNQVPAGEGVILKKIGDNTTAAVKVLASTEALSNNVLVGVTEANTVSLEALATMGNAYVLVSDEKFSKVSEGASGYISAGKAYLEYTPFAGASVNSLRISFGEPTAVADVEAKQETGDNAIYNVQGIRVSKPTAPGMYIMNGKAFIVK